MLDLESYYSLQTLFSNDEYKFDDEKLASNLYLTSFSKSQNEITIIRETDPKEADRLDKENDWLEGKFGKSKTIPAIKFEKLPFLCNVMGLQSPDALLLDYRNGHLNFLIEFKNCTRKTLERRYLDPKQKDYILQKFYDAKKLITKKLSFSNYDNGDCFISKTHIIIVYDGKNDSVSRFPQSKIEKSNVSRDHNGKQNRASRVSFTDKNIENPIEERFCEEINKLRFAKCKKEYFPIPGVPNFKRNKAYGKIRDCSFFSAEDFVKLIEEYNFFDEFDYGVYQLYFDGYLCEEHVSLV